MDLDEIKTEDRTQFKQEPHQILYVICTTISEFLYYIFNPLCEIYGLDECVTFSDCLVI